jgi:hypothetical protein
MTENDQTENIQRLRRYVADLEAENAVLRGGQVPSASAVTLKAENAELRRQLAAAVPVASGGSPGEHLTVPQVAQALNLSTWQVLRELRESLPLSVDAKGQTVISRKDLDTYLLAKAQGRPTRRFL